MDFFLDYICRASNMEIFQGSGNAYIHVYTTMGFRFEHNTVVQKKNKTKQKNDEARLAQLKVESNIEETSDWFD